jgi:preprotein translocase subunit SecE
VARQTRSQRRARREAEGAQAGAPPRRPTRPTENGEDGGRRQPPPPPRRERGSFVAESWGELKKVEWPGQSQVIQATVVVLVACIVVGIYLYVNDRIWSHVVQWIIGQ